MSLDLDPAIPILVTEFHRRFDSGDGGIPYHGVNGISDACAGDFDLLAHSLRLGVWRPEVKMAIIDTLGLTNYLLLRLLSEGKL